MPASYSLAIDIGGTFTDVVLRSSAGELWVDKCLTTHNDLLDGMFQGTSEVLRAASAIPSEVTELVVHATTIVTNAVIERKGARTAFVTTQGFKDVLELRTGWRFDMFDLQLEFPEQIVPDDLCFGINERTFADGTIDTNISADAAASLAEDLKRLNVESVAICFLNSYANPSNERALAEFLRSSVPNIYISLSSNVAPQIREYLRASTTSINAYTMPISQPYLTAFSEMLLTRGFSHKPMIMLSNGGIAGCKTAGAYPVRMIESGPAAGALAAAYFAGTLGLDRMMSFDMGGTTAKACLIEDKKAAIIGQFEIDRINRFKVGSGLPVVVPSVDLIEIGAGGGSIARVDALGLLKVGPQSAGSNPGPACYDRGGTQPTVTDADLVLGILDPKNFLGGSMLLNADKAHAELKRLGESLGMGAEDAAAGVYLVVSETMALAARAHAADRGVDYRGMPLFAFGGAGPMHACQVGELLESSVVIFPPQASVLSAFGTLVTPPRLDLVHTMLVRLEQIKWDDVDTKISDMIEQAKTSLAEAGCEESEIQIIISADMRYIGQQNEVNVVLREDPREKRDISVLRSSFEQLYSSQYRISMPNVAVQIVNWRVVAQGREVKMAFKHVLEERSGSPKGTRYVSLWKMTADVWNRSSLAKGQIIIGPALVEERETTTVIPPGWKGTVDKSGCILAAKEK